MNTDNGYKLFEVYVPITGTMRVHLRAKDKQDALDNAGKIALDIEKDSTDTMIPNLYSWKLDRTVCPIIIERGEADE